MKRSNEEDTSNSSKKTKNQPMEFSQSKLVKPARSSQERRESTSEELKRLIEPPKDVEPIVLSSDDEEDIIMQKDALKNSLKATTSTSTPPTPNIEDSTTTDSKNATALSNIEDSTTTDNKNATASPQQQETVIKVGSLKGKEKEPVAESSRKVGSLKGKEREVAIKSSKNVGTVMTQYRPPAPSNVVDTSDAKANADDSFSKLPSSSTLENDDEVYELQSDSEDKVQGSSRSPLATTSKVNHVNTSGSSVKHNKEQRQGRNTKSIDTLSLALSVSSLSIGPAESVSTTSNTNPVNTGRSSIVHKKEQKQGRKTKSVSTLSLGLSVSSLSSAPAESDSSKSDNEENRPVQPQPTKADSTESESDEEEDRPVQPQTTNVPRCLRPHPPRRRKFDPFATFRESLETTRRKLKTGFVFDLAMTYHEPLNPAEDHPEKPERLFSILAKFDEYHLLGDCERITRGEATKKELELAHNRIYINELEELDDDDVTVETIKALEEKYKDSLYFNATSYNAAVVAAGSLTNLMEAVIKDDIKNGFAIIRPPGHHAERDMPMGFCLFNNVAVAIKSCQKKLGVKKILIVDWDVHFGNGTQDIFSDRKDVLYLSLHRYEDGSFYPSSMKGAADYVGQNEGYTVNIPWSCAGVTDADYLFAFERVVMPIAREFDPELVVVSAGFDAAEGDPLGECHVTPGGYGHLTHLLKGLAGGRVVMALEGGYNLQSIAVSALASMRVLMGEAPSPLDPSLRPSQACKDTVAEVLSVQAKYWNSLTL